VRIVRLAVSYTTTFVVGHCRWRSARTTLTFLRSMKAENEIIGGMSILVATVEPVFM
jgi:hypothetical protein